MNTNSNTAVDASAPVNNTNTPAVATLKKKVGRKSGIPTITEINYSDIAALGISPDAKIVVGVKWLQKVKTAPVTASVAA